MPLIYEIKRRLMNFMIRTTTYTPFRSFEPEITDQEFL